MKKEKLSTLFMFLALACIIIYIIWVSKISPAWDVPISRWDQLKLAKIPGLYAGLPCVIFYILAVKFGKKKKD